MDVTMSPAYVLRAYAWELLQANDPDTWDKSKYGGSVPIVPVSEEPELEEFSGPHIVYGYALSNPGSLEARKTGSVTFAVYDQNFRRLTKTLNILQAAFERQDESARDINEFTSRVTNSAGDRPFLGLTFGYVGLGFVEGGTPEDSEDGPMSAIINIRFEYHVDYGVKQYRRVNPDSTTDLSYGWV